jgi:hypothetical protein
LEKLGFSQWLYVVLGALSGLVFVVIFLHFTGKFD